MSRGVVHRQPLTEIENAPQDGHAEAVSSSVTTWTTRVPSGSRWTLCTARPGRSSNNVVPFFIARGPSPRCVRYSKCRRSRARSPQAHRNPSILKIEEPRYPCQPSVTTLSPQATWSVTRACRGGVGHPRHPAPAEPARLDDLHGDRGDDLLAFGPSVGWAAVLARGEQPAGSDHGRRGSR
jgi:hypothetical protein